MGVGISGDPGGEGLRSGGASFPEMLLPFCVQGGIVVEEVERGGERGVARGAWVERGFREVEGALQGLQKGIFLCQLAVRLVMSWLSSLSWAPWSVGISLLPDGA